MPLRFSAEAPNVPDELVNELLDGDVVFLCGAGVSAPQLPTFEQLVDDVYARLGLEQTVGEQEVRKAGRYEEILGAIMRRLVKPDRLYEEVADILSLDKADLRHHKILLRLSRARDNKPLLVTTNFEGLFERALDELEGEGRGLHWSLAGQALPPPGADACHGIIHLHGRIRDALLGLEATPLVLTSAEYGDAYMRSGWASRFLFDLARCKTIVLVGYSANDAPVRYFLNLLEGDRDRFGDLRTVYAFDAYDEADPGAIEARWATVAVTPLAYRKEDAGHPDRHHTLWETLGALADLAENPRVWRRKRLEESLSQSFATVGDVELGTVDWILRGKSDLWDVVIGCLEDAAWFDHFFTAQIWSEEEASNVIAAWCLEGLRDPRRFDFALKVHVRLGSAFARALNSRLVLKLGDLPRPWAIAWKTLIVATVPAQDAVTRNYGLARKLRSTAVDDRDLRDAIAALTPGVELKQRWWIDKSDTNPQAVENLRDLASVSLSLDDLVYLDELNEALRAVGDRRRRLIQIADDALCTIAAYAEDIGLITTDWDALDQGVPSVERHDQNLHHDGAVQLCELLTDLFRSLGTEDRGFARAIAETWASLPGVLGYRLLVDALRQPTLFEAGEVAEHILSLPRQAFWSMRRELVLAMRERLGDAPAIHVDSIVTRILVERDKLYTELEIEGAVDWRPQARDHRVWLLLTAIRMAGVLPLAGIKELEAIEVRHSFIKGDYTEEDLFGSYSYGVRSVQGDPAPVAAAVPEERLETARELRMGFDFTSRLSWSAYCSAEPTAAFEVLKDAPHRPENIGIWSDFLQSLEIHMMQESQIERSGNYKALLPAAFVQLNGADDEFLSGLLHPLSSLLRNYAGLTGARDESRIWWDRLWRLAEAHESPVEEADPERFYERVINRPAGKLVEWLLSAIDADRKQNAPTAPDRHRLRSVLRSDTTAGWLGRGVCAYNAGFVLHLDARLALGPLRSAMTADDSRGRALRAALLRGPLLGFVATRAYKVSLFAALRECQTREQAATYYVSKVLHPLLSWRMTPYVGKPALAPQEVRRLLESTPRGVLTGAAQCLRQWVSRIGVTPENAWRTFIGPLFKAVWPNEARFRSAAVSGPLAALCVGAGSAFENALSILEYYLSPFDSQWNSVYFLEASDAPTNAPVASLELLWRICGPGASGRSADLAAVLDRIVDAAPALAVDRRVQWMEQHRAIRYG